MFQSVFKSERMQNRKPITHLLKECNFSCLQMMQF